MSIEGFFRCTCEISPLRKLELLACMLFSELFCFLLTEVLNLFNRFYLVQGRNSCASQEPLIVTVRIAVDFRIYLEWNVCKEIQHNSLESSFLVVVIFRRQIFPFFD